ncbi:extracellular solute-binding protein [Cohnella herbarum]|uniref:Extracellular solute-binding protein n=1 Tax=Cohnella herbarum TaxID=2728023 RepID=A0A7Z2VP48_9BACL|nr:extracellular solute-binding protein [Cohnella herbarum]
MKRRACKIIAFLIVSMLLAACSAASENGETGSNALPISVFAQQEATQNLETNDFTKELERRFNVKFDWHVVPYEGAKEKRQISLAGGEYADAYILTTYIDQFSQADVLRYGKQGVFVPLNDLIDQYAPNIKAAMAKDATLKAFNTAPDGNIYGLVSYSECFHCSYPNKMWLNTEWLKKLNLEMPTTTEEFKQVLLAFKTRDPNGNGKADEIPLSGSTEDFGVRVIPYLMNGFIYDDDKNYLNLTNGKVDTVANKSEWKEGLTYIKGLYDEGLIDPGAFTQNSDAYKKIGENAGAQILGAGTAMHPAIFVDTGPDNDRGSDYNPVPPLLGPHSSYAVYNTIGVSPGAKFVITDKASKEQRIALIRMVDYMYTPEGQAFAEVGKEGLDWRRPIAGERALGPNVSPAFTRIPVKVGDKPNNAGWSGMGHFYMPKEYRDSWVQGSDIYAPDGYERRLYEATLVYEGHEPKETFPIWSAWIDSNEADEANFLQTNIKSYVEENALRFITGNKNLNEDWDGYVRGLADLKIARYVEIMQKAYDRSLKSDNE